MKRIFEIFKDPRLYAPLLFIVCFELFLQTEVYKHLMQPRSYADNVNRIIRLAGEGKDPTVLLLGTSVAYQGIQVPYLYELMSPQGIIPESGACEGAKLETQHLIARSLLSRMPHIKTVVHMVEASHPGTARNIQDQANRSMVAQFPRSEVYHVLHGHSLRLTYSDYLYFTFRTLTYQKDLRDFVLDPLDRFKGIGRRFKEKANGFVYENKITYKLSAYPAKNAEECVRVSAAANIEQMGKEVTDNHHRNAVMRTCQIVVSDPLNGPGNAQWTALYFQRLKFVYKDFTDRGINVLVVFTPYSELISDLNSEYRMQIWKDGLAQVIAPGNLRTLDLRKSLDGPNNSDLYYDTIHLNKEGARQFTKKFADASLPILQEMARLKTQ